jgi:TPR repeat protein
VDKRDVKTLRTAAEGGDLSALLSLGWRHINGIGVPVNRTRAHSLLTAAATKQDPRANCLLAQLILLKGTPSPPQDVENVITALKGAVAKGHALSAHFCLQWPVNYPGGQLKPSDRNAYVKVAAEGGLLQAMDSMYQFHKYGGAPEFPKDDATANAWAAKVITKLEVDLTELEVEDILPAALLIMNAPYVPNALKSSDAVFNRLRLAADLGDIGAMITIQGMYRAGKRMPPPFFFDPNGRILPWNPPPLPPNFPSIPDKEGVGYIFKASFLGNVEAMYNTADILLQGGQKDASLLWLRAAADRGHPLAVQRIKGSRPGDVF